ncbi:unnamed protein product [Heligmosomoides polygyrus]|uniref:Uncharacterized protein n=1 Tax=Heligmosomoides polygyrus TaxID=6339 RepID=A0A183FFC9_HELPZ|nr:unnamed protein product [Heligmosomoides polygyrus]
MAGFAYEPGLHRQRPWQRDCANTERVESAAREGSLNSSGRGGGGLRRQGATVKRTRSVAIDIIVVVDCGIRSGDDNRRYSRNRRRERASIASEIGTPG